jgi:hypothetical protein
MFSGYRSTGSRKRQPELPNAIPELPDFLGIHWNSIERETTDIANNSERRIISKTFAL